ncbi:MAG: AAA family ATPase [Prevotella sp.]
MSIYINEILIHRLLDKKGLKIQAADGGQLHHFIVTGPNGAGKTTLFNSIAESLDLMFQDTSFNYNEFKKNLELDRGWLSEAKQEGNIEKIQKFTQLVDYYQNQCEKLWGTVELSGLNYPEIFTMARNHQYVIAFFGAERLSHFIEVKSPEKPDLTQNVLRSSKTEEFIKFLVDLKFQQAMANNEGNKDDVEKIDKWFKDFENILKKLFSDDGLRLSFDYKKYIFYIEKTEGCFSLADLSDGYSSALDIVADIILKMQDGNNVVRSYDVPGIVFIDEIETHLHLKLQRDILPFLTTLFPKIQFFVTTHSPFVLNSIKNAVVYDLKEQKPITDLSDYSYEIIAEGYFGVKTESDKLVRHIERLKWLIENPHRTTTEEETLQSLIRDFEALPDIVAPEIKAQYHELMISYKSK